MLDFFKKNLSLKIALFSTALTGVFSAIALFVLSSMSLTLNPANIMGVLSLVSLAFIVFGFFLNTLLVNLSISRPLAKITTAMQKVEEGNLTIQCDLTSEDEFGEMAERFNRMVKSLGEMNETRKRIEQRLIKTEESLKYKMALEEKAQIIERMNSELTDAFNNVALLYTVSQYLHTVLDLNELVSTIQKIFEEKFPCDQYALYFSGPIDDELQLASYKGFRNQERWENHRIRPGEGLAGRVAEKNKAIYLEQLGTETEASFSELEQRLKGSVYSLPLHVRGNLIGVLTVARQSRDAFTSTDRQSLQSIASQIAITYDRCKLYTRTKELSVRDELTGIANRRHFQQALDLEIKRAERYKRQVALLMIDADHFKKFNDTFGHLRGDELLRQMARLLKKNLREVDLVARYGGEEFIVMLTDTSLNDAVNVANKLRELVKLNLKINTPIPSGAAPDSPFATGVSISIGVSHFPDCAATAAELINTADMALYSAKHKGRDRVEAYQVGALPLEEFMNKMGMIH